MHGLVSDSCRLLKTRKSRRLQAIDFQHIRENAESLHGTLECGPWECCCPEPHQASLALESRLKPTKTNVPLKASGTQLQLRFRVLFKSNPDISRNVQDWRETEFVPRVEPEIGCTTTVAPYASRLFQWLKTHFANDHRPASHSAQAQKPGMSTNASAPAMPEKSMISATTSSPTTIL